MEVGFETLSASLTINLFQRLRMPGGKSQLQEEELHQKSLLNKRKGFHSVIKKGSHGHYGHVIVLKRIFHIDFMTDSCSCHKKCIKEKGL